MSEAIHVNAEADYLLGMKYKEIADKYSVTINTVKSWKQRHGWNRKSVHTKSKSVHTKIEAANRPRVRGTADVIEPEELTEKQRLFVIEYLRDFNATRAAIVVGYSKKTAYSIGWELLRKPEIQAEIKRLKDIMADELGLDVKRVIAEYMKIAFTDITDLLEFGQKDVPVMTMFGPLKDDNGQVVMKTVNYVAFNESDQIDGTVISEVKQGKDGVSIKLHDKMRALDKLEKYVGFMSEEERLKLDKLRAEVKVLKGLGGSKPKDDGFIEALKGRAAEVWGDEPDPVAEEM